MSLHVAAKHLAAHGRGPDTTLVHMAPSEVAGLQALARAHGGSLTVNPHTGLPEAGFLTSILPTVVGFAVGDPFLGATIGAGLGYAKSGTLMGALSGGLGGYGGAQLGAGVAGLGTSEMGADVGAAAQQQADQQVQQAVAERTAAIQAQKAQELADMGQGFESTSTGALNPSDALAKAGQTGFSEAFMPKNVTQLEELTTPTEYSLPPELRNYGYGGVGTTPPLQPLTPEQTQNMRAQFIDEAAANTVPAPTHMQALQRGIGAIIDDPSKLAQAGGGSWASLAKTGAMALAPGVPDLLKKPAPPTAAATANPVYSYNSGAINPTPQPNPYGIEQLYYDPSKAGYVRTAADGGMMTEDGDTQGDPNLMAVKTYDPVVRMDKGGRAQAADTAPMKKPKGLTDMPSYADMPGLTDTAGLYASGGLSSLGGYSDGGRLLRGPGDGVSDSIPAVIGQKQPARLADGEFVIPARIVSELGNGSTEAGARQLYKMMDRVQAARAKTTAKGKVAKQNNPQNMMPA